MPERPTRNAALDLLNATLGVWLGIYAFRTFVPTAVWNLSDALPLQMKAVVALGVHALGVAGCVLPVTRRPYAAAALALSVGFIGIGRQIFLGNDAIGSSLSLAGWILWLWWLAAFARSIGPRNAHILAVAIALGFLFQVGMQAAWHGLDLPMARGLGAVACAAIVNTLFALTAYMRLRPADGPSGGTYVLLVAGAVFFLELTLFANVGRIGFVSNAGLVPAALLIQAGSMIGLAVASMARGRSSTFASALVLVVATLAAPWLHGAEVILLVLGHAALMVLLVSSAARATSSGTAPYAAGMVVLFALVFLFYNNYEWPALWVVAAVIAAGVALPAPGVTRIHPSFAFSGAAGVLLTVLGLMEYGTDSTPPADGRLRVLTYNIRQGYDAAGVPAMQSIAEEIQRINADVIALQEVGRGWTFVGGADLVAYLAARFPDYRIHFVPVNGQLWGVALMSRVPMSALEGRAFDSPSGAFRYGYAAGMLVFGSEAVRVASVHLTAGLDVDGGDGRTAEAEQLLRALGDAANSVIAGDLNTHPDEEPVQRILAAGYGDAAAIAGLGGIKTWPAHAPTERIDYVLTRGTFKVDSVEIRSTTVSDHLPVFVRLTLTSGGDERGAEGR